MVPNRCPVSSRQRILIVIHKAQPHHWLIVLPFESNLIERFRSLLGALCACEMNYLVLKDLVQRL